jgi:hypothetical protein
MNATSAGSGDTTMLDMKRYPMRIFLGIGLMMLCGLLSPTLAQKPDQEIPLLTTGAMPLYPPVAVHARIQGVVKIRVKTDGRKVASVETVSGPPMLAKAAIANIHTWEFSEHKPTTFLTTFEYVIEEPSECSYRNAISLLKLPLEARISTKGLMTCDPEAPIKRLE